MDEPVNWPSDEEAVAMVQAGMSFAAIHAELERRAGRELLWVTVSAYLSRAALVHTTGHRYFDAVPWRLQPAHQAACPARMLRLLGRHRSGFPLHEEQLGRLDAWLTGLERDRLVVAYSPLLTDGFAYVDEAYRSGPNPDLPIRVRVLEFSELIELGLAQDI